MTDQRFQARRPYMQEQFIRGNAAAKMQRIKHDSQTDSSTGPTKSLRPNTADANREINKMYPPDRLAEVKDMKSSVVAIKVEPDPTKDKVLRTAIKEDEKMRARKDLRPRTMW